MPPTHATNKKFGKWMKMLRNYLLFGIWKNSTYNSGQFMQLLLSTASQKESLHETSMQLGFPSADDFYYHAKQKLSKADVLRMVLRYTREALNAIRNMSGIGSFDIAIDFTDEPYYGETENPYVVGGKRKASTNYAFRYITVTIVNKGERFVIYAFPVSKEDKKDAILVTEAVLAVKRLGIKIRRAYLDREFVNSEIFLFFDQEGIKFIVPGKKDCKVRARIEEYRREKKTFPRIIENYEVNGYPVNLLLLEDEKGSGKIYGFLTNIDATEIQKDPYAIAKAYRERWAIENANKYQDVFNIHTNCRDGILRYLFFAITVLLHNFWVLANMVAPTLGLKPISLSFFKKCIEAAVSHLPRPRSKCPQRERWAAVLG